MNDIIIFSFGCIVTLAVGIAVGMLLYVASREP